MSRKKSKAKAKAKGATRSTPHRAPTKRQSSQSWPAPEATAPKFSLTDEARWMSNHRTAAYETGKKLRHMPIQFVSAGRLEGTIKEAARAPIAAPANLESDDESIAPSSTSSSASHHNTDAMAHMAIRSPSPAISANSSSADEVVFRGRGPDLSVTLTTSAPNVVKQAEATSSFATALVQTTPTIAEFEVQPSAEPTICVKATTDADPDGLEEESDTESVAQAQFSKRRGGKPSWEGATTAWEHRSKPNIGWLPAQDRPDMDTFLRDNANSRDAAMDDYMQNTADFGLTNSMMAAAGFAHREMDLDAGSHNDWESASGSQEEQEDGLEENDSWDSDMLQDLEDLSTSSDAMDTIVRILAKRNRPSGLHYLCVYENSIVDDSRWLPQTLLKSTAEKNLIRAFEENLSLREGQRSSSSDEEDNENEDDDEIDDETIARVLQKQEELGLGSDEILLYAGDEQFDRPFGATAASFGIYGRPNKKRQSRMRGNREPTFPSATALADALSMDPYGGFDIMDTERPSLRYKKKGRKGHMPPELDDSDLNEQIQNTWEADRAKKRLKKAEREELRQQGLLGRKGKAPDLKVRYQGGVGMDDVVEEIREFLMGDIQTLSLPPMESNRRAAIHQVAFNFNLSSRSRGDGHNRFTILSKTLHSRTYTNEEFDIVLQRKGIYKRLQGPFHGEASARASRGYAGRQGARNRVQTGYKDGETVGANAPALGPENKGHALLKKMGWSHGMGLGALDNKGILQPISHTVKTNKAGLQ